MEGKGPQTNADTSETGTIHAESIKLKVSRVF